MGSVILIVICALVLLAAVTDIRSLTIPNMIPLFILAAFAFTAIFDPTYIVDLENSLISAAVIFVITFIMFAAGILGAGDSKLLAALGLWIPIAKIWGFVLIMSLMGAVLGVVALTVRKSSVISYGFEEGSWFGQLKQGRSAVPYAVAIAVAFFAVAFPWQPF